jgi:uncharacterized protein (TIGR03435 family)
MLILALRAAFVWGQSTASEFEVVSIKPMPAWDGRAFHGCRGGPGAPDPGLITCSHVSSEVLVRLAYDVDRTRISWAKMGGAPNETRFGIGAKVPRGASAKQVRLMWQKLLADRLKLAVHRETQEVPVYELVVGKGGFKAKEWVDRPENSEAPEWEPGVDPKRDKDGIPILRPGQALSFYSGDKALFVAPAGTIHDLAVMLEGRLDINEKNPRPVIDATGLNGKYDLKVSWSPRADTDPSDPGLPVLRAIEIQLGLRVEPRKSAPVEMLVIDHIERTPTEN